MPELPEVETVRRILEPNILGRTIRGVTLRGPFTPFETTFDGAEPASLLIGSVVTGTSRRGKYLGVHLDNELALIVHLRMTGRLLLLPVDTPPVRFEHAAIHLDQDLDLRFGDQRKFGRLAVVTLSDVAALDSRLGPEPLGPAFSAADLALRLSRRSGKLKNALLDQHLIAGLGNIYVDEALYRSRLHPLRVANSLTPDETELLVTAIRDVLQSALENQGTTFSSFENPYGEAGSNADFLHIYAKGGTDAICPRCGSLFERLVVGGRGTSFCPTCQVISSQPG